MHASKQLHSTCSSAAEPASFMPLPPPPSTALTSSGNPTSRPRSSSLFRRHPPLSVQFVPEPPEYCLQKTLCWVC
jgi:hypothetical protein